MLEPVIRAYAPELIIVSAGFDAVQGDPLGGMNLTPQVFGHMTDRLSHLAGGGKLVLALEGGYNLRMTAECGAECVKVCWNSLYLSLWPYCCRAAAPSLQALASAMSLSPVFVRGSSVRASMTARSRAPALQHC